MRLRILAFIAKLLRIQFSVDGFPYGAMPKYESHSLANQCTSSHD